MGFPDDFVFKGSKIEIARQIGNAVPPQLAGAAAKLIKEALSRSRRSSKTRRAATEATSAASLATKR
jgi:DNA (cytosine-5)-methyltransferase 1